jgi:hypothetical protein
VTSLPRVRRQWCLECGHSHSVFHNVVTTFERSRPQLLSTHAVTIGPATGLRVKRPVLEPSQGPLLAPPGRRSNKRQIRPGRLNRLRNCIPKSGRPRTLAPCFPPARQSRTAPERRKLRAASGGGGGAMDVRHPIRVKIAVDSAASFRGAVRAGHGQIAAPTLTYEGSEREIGALESPEASETKRRDRREGSSQ